MDTRKRILFAAYGLGLGGIEKCLVNLLNAMPEDRYDVDVLLMNPEYQLVPQVKKSVHFIDAFDYILSSDCTMDEIRRRGGYWKNREKLIPYVCHRVRIWLGKRLWLWYQPLPKEYDIAVAYSQNGEAPYYVIDKVSAKRKILWYHNGAYEKTGKAYALDQEYYVRFDHIVAVSQDCKQMLGRAFPEMAEKILVLRSICDAAVIRESAKAFQPESYRKGPCHIVTIGRMEKEKGTYLVLEACRILCGEGKDICWHWVGNGHLTEEIREKVRALGLEERFILEGNQSNPYPYLENGDIYVQPSFYEAFSTTVREARILCKPIVTTDVGGMKEQLVHGETGWIVPISAEEIASGVLLLLEKPELAKSFVEALKQEDHSAKTALEAYEKTVFA